MLLTTLKRRLGRGTISPAARRERRRDRRDGLRPDPGADEAVTAAAAWLGRAQDRSTSADGGVARHYSLIDGWSTSYPETTGYIVPTLLAVGDHTGVSDHRARAQRMLDWLVSIQLADGGFQGGRIDARPIVPVTFNTGQILIGLAAGVQAFGTGYVAAMHGAARFLRDSQDADGCWRRHPTPFAAPGEKAYETHAALGLFRAAAAAPGHGYKTAGLRQIDWALGKQQDNGWVADCCLNDPARPLTHTLGYFLRGVLEAYDAAEDARHLDAACRTADGLMTAQRTDGALPGRLTADWAPAANWVCVTGLAQIAECWWHLAETTGRADYASAAAAANRFVRRTMDVDGYPDIRGGVKGSFPVDGGYGAYEYLNWAAKFTIDANLAEIRFNRTPR